MRKISSTYRVMVGRTPLVDSNPFTSRGGNFNISSKYRNSQEFPLTYSLTSCPQNLIKVSSIASRAGILGRFVARQLSGMDPSSVSCTNQQLELHLRAIREKIETSVIPLGMLRFGSYLERALLFKVLADRIALPASLVRGSYGTSWIEIAVPVTTVRFGRWGGGMEREQGWGGCESVIWMRI